MDVVDVSKLKPGDRIQTLDGNVAEVLDESQDGQWVKVKYIAGVDGQNTDGEDLVSAEDIRRVTPKDTDA